MKRKDIHIAAAGSLLGVKFSSPGSFPGGRVNFLHLFPMSFMEFHDGTGEARYRQLIEDMYEPISLSEALYSHSLKGFIHYNYNHFSI